jgi:hypothetical protein
VSRRGRSLAKKVIKTHARQLLSEHDHMKPKTLRKAANKTISAKRRGRAFERAIARMAADPVMRAECAAITKDFRFAEADGLRHGDCYED